MKKLFLANVHAKHLTLYPTNYSQKPLLKAVSLGIGQVAADIEGKIIIIDLSTYNLLVTITVT